MSTDVQNLMTKATDAADTLTTYARDELLLRVQRLTSPAAPQAIAAGGSPVGRDRRFTPLVD